MLVGMPGRAVLADRERPVGVLANLAELELSVELSPSEKVSQPPPSESVEPSPSETVSQPSPSESITHSSSFSKSISKSISLG